MKIKLYIILGVLLFVTINVYIYRLAVSEEHEKSLKLEMHLTKIGEINSELDKSLLYAKQTKVTSYDNIVQLSNEIKKEQFEVSRILTHGGVSMLSDTSSIVALMSLVDEKQYLIERFKSKNSVLRNSLNAVGVLIESVDLKKENENLNHLEISLLKYYTYSKHETTAALRAEILNFETQNLDGNKEVEMFFLHAKVILDLAPELSELLKELIQMEIAATADRINSQIEFTSQNYLSNLKYLILFCVILNSILFFLITYALLKLYKKSKELVGLNEGLEGKIKIRTQEIEASLLALEKKNVELDQFSYVVSHDLKAPLRAISTLSSFIEEDLGDSVDEESKTNFALLRNRAERMKHLIDDILNYSKVGREELEIETLDLQLIIAEIKEGLDCPSEMKINISTELPKIRAPHVFIHQIFGNLLSNAIKYHDKADGTIDIGMRTMGDSYELFVKDNGPGIEKMYQTKIFEMFKTIEKTDDPDSTGIGLSTVKKMVEEIGGAIRVDSEYGEGSTFSVVFSKDKVNIVL